MRNIFLLLVLLPIFSFGYDTTYVSKTDGQWDKIVSVGVGCPCTTIVSNTPSIVSSKTNIIINVCQSTSSTFNCSTGSGCTWTSYCSTTPATTCWKPTIKQVYGNLTVSTGVHVYIGNDLVVRDGGSVDISGEVFLNGGLTVEGNGVSALEATLTLNNGIFRFSGAFNNDGIVQGTGKFYCCGAFNSNGTCTSGTCGWTANPWGYDACFFGDCDTRIQNNSICIGGYVLSLYLIKFGIEDNYLRWVTVNEEKIKSFVVQYSIDGKVFRDLVEKNPLNDRYNEYSIQITDNGYYRLKIIDQNEIIDYTYVISNFIDFDKWVVFERGDCVYWIGPEAKVTIYNSFGQYIGETTEDEIRLPSGLFILIFTDNQMVKTFKIKLD